MLQQGRLGAGIGVGVLGRRGFRGGAGEKMVTVSLTQPVDKGLIED